MAKCWPVNLMAHRQPLLDDNHDSYVIVTLILYEKEKTREN